MRLKTDCWQPQPHKLHMLLLLWLLLDQDIRLLSLLQGLLVVGTQMTCHSGHLGLHRQLQGLAVSQEQELLLLQGLGAACWDS